VAKWFGAHSNQEVRFSSAVYCKKGPQVLTSLHNQRQNYQYYQLTHRGSHKFEVIRKLILFVNVFFQSLFFRAKLGLRALSTLHLFFFFFSVTP